MRRIIKRVACVLLALLLLLAGGILSLIRSDIPPAELMAKYAGQPSKFLDVHGLAVHYRDEGQGPPLVLLHGAASSLHTWESWTRALSKDYRVMRLDLPGFGLTGPTAAKDYSMPANVQFLADFLDKLGVKETNLAGNSYGGRIAWEFAYAHPERVRKLILVDASAYPNPHRRMLAMRMARMPVVSSIMRRATPRFLIATTIRDVYGDPKRVTDAVIDRYYDLILRAGNRETFGILSRMEAPDPGDRIRSLRPPTLILWGALDRGMPPAFAERLHREIANSKLIVYPGVGHVPMEEIPEVTARDAAAFLAE